MVDRYEALQQGAQYSHFMGTLAAVLRTVLFFRDVALASRLSAFRLLVHS